MSGVNLSGQLLYLSQSTIIPHDLFYAAPVSEVLERPFALGRRFIRKQRANETGECLIYTDASYHRNGTEDAVGECVIACEPLNPFQRHLDEGTSFMDVALQERKKKSGY